MSVWVSFYINLMVERKAVAGIYRPRKSDYDPNTRLGT